MKRISLVSLALLVGTLYSICYAQRNLPVAKEIQEAFIARTDTISGQAIHYRETLICPEASDSMALVIFLHSAGWRGSDNLSHLGMPALKDIYEYLSQHKIHAYFIAPQCPETASWNGLAPGSLRSSPHRPLFDDRMEKLEDGTPYVEYLMPFLKQYITDRPISKSKIYILGASMGAAGTWQLISQYPDFFSAAMPVSAVFSGKDITPLKSTPIVCVTGSEENSFNKNRSMIEKLREAGAEAIFIPLNGLGHVEACNKAFSVQNLDLLFSLHRKIY